MAKQEKNESALAPVSSQYRTAAGLPPRESDAPTDLSKAELTKSYEPEGGYGGKDGIKNDGALNSSESARQGQRSEQAAQRAEQLEATGLTGGETATQAAIVTGDDIVDEKPHPGYTPENEPTTGDEE